MLFHIYVGYTYFNLFDSKDPKYTIEQRIKDEDYCFNFITGKDKLFVLSGITPEARHSFTLNHESLFPTICVLTEHGLIAEFILRTISTLICENIFSKVTVHNALPSYRQFSLILQSSINENDKFNYGNNIGYNQKRKNKKIHHYHQLQNSLDKELSELKRFNYPKKKIKRNCCRK